MAGTDDDDVCGMDDASGGVTNVDVVDVDDVEDATADVAMFMFLSRSWSHDKNWSKRHYSDCRALAFPIPFSTIAWLVYSGFPALLPPRSASVLIDPWILDWALCLLRSHARFALSRVQYFPQNPGIGLRTVAAGPLNCSTSTGQLP